MRDVRSDPEVYGLNGGLTKAGSRTLTSCSNRGLCDTNTGTCRCYTGFGASDNGGGDVDPAAGPIFNCG